MKLQILIPHYKETDEVIKPMLDSLALQQNIDFGEFGVIICNDGSDVRLSDGLLHSYPFEIQYHLCPHQGVSATRNECLDRATADYVMFCDADDMFASVYGLWLIFREMETGFDSLVSVFLEESRMPDGSVMYLNHNDDTVFVHGKVHRRGYLLEQCIRWNPNLTIHEDSFFNILCRSLSDNVKYCPTPFYLWKWRDDSVCRHDTKYILKTYNNLLDSCDALCDEFVKRGLADKAAAQVASIVFDAYYMMNKPEWLNQENQEYRTATEKRFSEFFAKREELWLALSDADKMQMSNGVRQRVVNEGMMMEAITLIEWLRTIHNR